MPQRDGMGWIRFGLPGLMLGLAIGLGTGSHGPLAHAQVPLPERPRTTAEANSTLAFTSNSSNNATGQLLYLVDTRARAFAVYRVDPSNPKGSVKLEAARQYNWDLKLAEYNNQPPEVTAIESTVKTLGGSMSR